MNIFLVLLFSLFSASLAQAGSGGCRQPFIFFDLGNTIVDTKTYDFKKIVYMPGALNYIRALKDQGYRLGLIVNIPESWGNTRAEKLVATRKFVEDLWTDSEPMTWNAFDLGILIPMKNSERKPAPALFEAALRLAAESGCPAIYEGEEHPEVLAAKAAGMKAYEVGLEPGFYLPIDKIDDFVRGR